MVKHATTALRPQAWRHTVTAVALAAALIVPFGYIFTQFWRSSGEDLTFTQSERAGIAYLRPLTRLVADLSSAETAAVQGQSAQGALRVSIAAVDTADRKSGEELGTQEQWASLNKRLLQLEARKLTGRAAYQSYSEAIDLTLALLTQVGDSSNLILDPQFDTYYLMDTTLLRLPSLLVDSGRLVDLARLAAVDPVAADPTNPDFGPQPDSGTNQVFAARDRVAGTAAAIDVGLKKSFDRTASSTLGPALLGHIDRVRTEVTEIAPSASLIAPPVSLAKADVDQMAASREQLREAAIQLNDATLTELDVLLDARQSGIDRQRTGVFVAIVLAALVGGWVLWSRLPERVREEPGETDEPGEPGRPGRTRAGGAGGTASQYRATEGAGAPEAGRQEEVSDLIDARQLLATGELVRVGRAVRPSRRERFRDDAE